MVIVLAVSRERCVFHVDRVWTSTRGSSSCGQGEGGQKPDFFVDIINGWPLSSRALESLVSLQSPPYLQHSRLYPYRHTDNLLSWPTILQRPLLSVLSDVHFAADKLRL